MSKFSSLFKFGQVQKTQPDLAKRKVKSGFDSFGMPYIDLSDRDTALIFQQKFKAFEGINTTKDSVQATEGAQLTESV